MLLPFDTIVRSIDFDQRASGMQLRPWQWEFLLGADGRTRLSDLARSCAIDIETAVALVDETEPLGLVEIVTLTLESYRAAAALLVTPVGATTHAAPALATLPHAIDFAFPTDPVAPKKGVSVSFDSFSTMMADWDVPVADMPPVAHEPETTPEHDLAASPLVANYSPARAEPIADHESYLDLPRFDTYGNPFTAPPVGFTLDAVPHDQHEFEHAHEHEHEHEHAHEHEAVPSHDGDALNADDLAFENAIEHARHVEHVEHVEPLAIANEASAEPPRKSVSFSLSADSFGLPTEPFDAPLPDARIAPYRAETTAVHTGLPKEDDVLLQHFGIEETPDGTGAAPVVESVVDTRTNSDLTGVVLRVLGLKK